MREKRFNIIRFSKSNSNSLNTKENEEWNIDTFLKSLSNTNIDNFIRSLNYLDKEKRKIVLSDERVKEYLKNQLITNGKDWRFCDSIFTQIELEEIKDIFDEEFINDYFYNSKNYKEHILLGSIFNENKDKNKTMDIILENEALFNAFKEKFSDIYSSVILDSKRLKKLIDKLVKTNSLECFSLLRIGYEEAFDLLAEDFSGETIMWIIDKTSIETMSDFYLNHPKAKLTIPYLQKYIDRYLDYGIVFGNEVIKNPNFFEILKSDSLLTFRERINLLEDQCNDPNFIEEKRKKYYDELINSYQEESDLFKIYEEVLKNPYSSLEELSGTKDPYIINRGIIYMCRGKKENFLEETNKKLSEIIVDALFQDNIYNVWINIKELLNYDSHLSLNEKVISKENLELYKFILEIDKHSNKEKIDLYNRLKDKNINLLFYDDIRKTKDLAYQKIKEKIIIPSNHPEYENKKETKKNGVVTYDLRNKEFYMLVRTLNGLYQENKTDRSAGSYSLISSNNTSVFESNNIIYGYNSFDIDKIEHMFEFDSYSSSYSYQANNSRNTTERPNRLSTLEEIADTAGYSEILIKNEKGKYKSYSGMKPDFIVVIDKIDEKSLEASKILNIPIVIIKRNENNKAVNFLMDKTEGYTQGNYLESERRNKR